MGGENFAIYGPAGNGKTRLAAAACRGDAGTWGSRSLYVAIDPGSQNLRPILKVDKPYIEKYVLGEGLAEGKPFDPYKELVKILDEDIPGQRGCQTIIVDTLTAAARDILQNVANSGKFSDKHVMIEGMGAGKLGMPMEGDYGAAQQCIMNFLRLQKYSPYNLIAIFHDGIWEPKDGSSLASFGGPITVGKGSIGPTAGWFDNLIRLESKSEGVGAKREVSYWATTEKKGPYLAKLRLQVPKNPIPEFKLDSDPVNFWQKLKELNDE